MVYNMNFSNSQFVRHPEYVTYNPIWDHLANHLGLGRIIICDGDMYIYVYNPKTGNQERFFKFEVKKQGVYMKGRGQIQINRTIDHALKNDHDCNYVGFYILWYLGESIGVRINYIHKLSWEDFYKFIYGKVYIKPFDLDECVKRNGWE